MQAHVLVNQTMVLPSVQGQLLHSVSVLWHLSVHPKTGNNHEKYTVSIVKHGIIDHFTSSDVMDHVALVMRMRLITGGGV